MTRWNRNSFEVWIMTVIGTRTTGEVPSELDGIPLFSRRGTIGASPMALVIINGMSFSGYWKGP